MFVATEVGDKESDDCKGGGDSQIAGDIGTRREEGYETHAVGEENEEEECEHVGKIFLIVLLWK